jgi:hypothetical protein
VDLGLASGLQVLSIAVCELHMRIPLVPTLYNNIGQILADVVACSRTALYRKV